MTFEELRKSLLKYSIELEKKRYIGTSLVAESFFHTLKTELTHHEVYRTRKQAKQSIFEYMEIFYNRKRIHSANNYLSLARLEEKMLDEKMVS